MYKGKILLVLTLGVFLLTALLSGCAAKKPLPAPVKQEVKAEAPKPAPPVVAPKAPEAPKVVEPTVPADLKLDSIYFDFDKFNIRDDQLSTSEKNAQLMAKWGTVNVRLEGNCDERGTEEYNLALGQRRADAVKSYLTNYGISSSRVETISYGEMRPVANEHSEEAWAKNRRVDSAITAK